MIEKKILIADDDPNVVKLIEAILSERHFTIVTTNDGCAVMSKVKEEHPDLIILDIMLPHIDGFQICEKLRQQIETKNIPILVISAHTSSQLILNLHSIGVNNYLSKPFDIPEFIDRVEYLYQKH